MNVEESPFLYGGALKAPLLTMQEDEIYLAIRDGKPMPDLDGIDPHFVADYLRTVADRLECDAQVARIGRYMECRAGYGDVRTNDTHVVAACVTVYADRFRVYCFNAAAAGRLANRLESGMEPAAAVERTLGRCDYREYTEAEIEALEKAADAHIRRLESLDRAFTNSIGSPEHVRAVRELP